MLTNSSFARFSVLVSLTTVFGCSGKSTTGDTAGGPLGGEWVGIGTLTGRTPTTVHITVQPGVFKVTTSENDALTAVASNDDYLVAYAPNNSDSTSFHATRSGASMDVGELPIQIGGTWLATNGGNGCTATLAPSTASGICGTIYSAPRWARYFMGGQAIGSRTATATSIFGELGGTWLFQTSGGAQCQIAFQGSSAQASCLSGSLPESVHIDFDGATASGGTSAGFEFSAHKL